MKKVEQTRSNFAANFEFFGPVVKAVVVGGSVKVGVVGLFNCLVHD